MQKILDKLRQFWLESKFFKADSKLDVVIHLSLVLILPVTLVLLLFSSFLPSITYHHETVTVPDITTMDIDEARRFLYQRDLEVVITDSSYSRKHKPNQVISQSPEPGAKVKRYRKIRLTINPKTVPPQRVPNLRDKLFEEAVNILKSANLEVGKVRYKPHKGLNTVLEQSYKGKVITPEDFKNMTVPGGSAIDLVIGDGLGKEEFPMPDLVGLSEEEARLVLSGSDLVLSNINYDYKSKRELGTVIRQHPTPFIGTLKSGVRAGSNTDTRERNLVRAGEIVDIWVSGNPAAKPRDTEEEDEDKLDPRSRRERDSLERNINIRSRRDYEEMLKKRQKDGKPADGNKTPAPKKPEDPKKGN